MHRSCQVSVLIALLGGAATHFATAGEKTSADLAAQLRGLKASVLPVEAGAEKGFGQMLAKDAQNRMQDANRRDNKAWQGMATKADWEKYRDERLAALRASLGEFPPVPKDLKVRITRTLEGDGYRIHNLVFESRPGLLVTANLYLPAKPSKSMPGILISHSHHSPKTQIELQEMGMTWARQGCLVLVPDHLGYSERRQHPFSDPKSYAGEFKFGRQNYYFRHNTALHLHAIGDSLMGWMVWDLIRGIDVLLAQPGVDRERIIVLGAVAGGGDPAAVAAALDPRILAVAPFNFGGPQPDYAVPDNVERDYYYFGVPTWETTRCLRNSARDGFSHWLIVSSVAPRRLIYSHEFGWEKEKDPVWPRMQKVFTLHEKPGHLAVADGKGNIQGRPPEHSHCNNIGVLHRSKIHLILAGWFGMPVPEKEFEQKRDPQDLYCLTPEFVKEVTPRLAHELAAEIGAQRAAVARQRLEQAKPKARRNQLRRDWARILGDVEPKNNVEEAELGKESIGAVTVERLVLKVEPGIVVPMLLLLPAGQASQKFPVVVVVAQEGKQAFLKQRSESLAEWLQVGVAVCLPDLRGTGETQPGGSRSWRTSATANSQAELMLGQTLVGSRLRDLRSVLQYLRTRSNLDSDRVGLWGDSFAPTNPAERNLKVPLDADKLPAQAEPLGGLLALLGALFEDRVHAVNAQGGLSDYQSLLHSPFIYVPHDCVVPGALTVGDLCDVAAALAPRPLRLDRMVDGLNRSVSPETLAKTYASTRTAYRSANAEGRLRLRSPNAPADAGARWLAEQLQGK